ncbi:hypothetical protein GCM10018779_40890 [Streptomyces griseocarneus]|nr:hypothetical protein GCM10018779_40890 [Streptomyces griseocarneus]
MLPGLLLHGVLPGVLLDRMLPRVLLHGVLPRVLLDRMLPRVLLDGVLPRVLLDGVLARVLLDGVLPGLLLDRVLSRVLLHGVLTRVLVPGVRGLLLVRVGGVARVVLVVARLAAAPVRPAVPGVRVAGARGGVRTGAPRVLRGVPAVLLLTGMGLVVGGLRLRLVLRVLLPAVSLVPVQRVLGMPRLGAGTPAVLSHLSPRAAQRQPVRQVKRESPTSGPARQTFEQLPCRAERYRIAIR